MALSGEEAARVGERESQPLVCRRSRKELAEVGVARVGLVPCWNGNGHSLLVYTCQGVEGRSWDRADGTKQEPLQIP